MPEGGPSPEGLAGHDPTRVQVWPVVQAVSRPRVVEQAAVAAECGADGVFLINHDADHAQLAQGVQALREELPDLGLGANLVREAPVAALRILQELCGGPPPLDALWTDDAQLSSAPGPDASHALWTETCDEVGWHGQHFGGVAFKYQTFVPDDELPALGRLARRWVDVPTTSGPGTGQAIALHRLELLRQGLGDHPLALASGVSVENARVLRPFVTHVLVSTSISTDGLLDAAKLRSLLDQFGHADAGD